MTKKTITSNGVSMSLRQPPRFLKTFTLIISSIVLFATFFVGCKKDNFEDEVVGLCPVVVSTDPMDKAVDVVLDKTISITFNTNMDATTINSSTFIIKQGTTVIAGVVSPTADAKTFTFKPGVALPPFALYSGTVTTGAKDPFHTAMVTDYVWSLTTFPVISVSAVPTTGGTVIGAGAFAQGSTATAAATPSTGFTFTNWTENGVSVSTSASYQFLMAGNRNLVANFAPVPVGNLALNLSSSPAAGGTTTGAGAYATGSSVTATAAANSGYTFVNWTDGATIVSTSNSYQFVLLTNRTLVANFRVIPATQFSVVLASSPVAGGTTDGEGSYNSGTSVTIRAVANTGYFFLNWVDRTTGAIASTSANYTFALTANRNFIANFSPITYILNVTAVNGTVSKTPNQANYNSGSTVVLTATPSAGYVFSSWSGNATGSANPLTVLMDADKNITANFTLIPPPPSLLGDASLWGAFGGGAGITNDGLSTSINGVNGNIGTTAAPTLITGFHDVTANQDYTVTPLNRGVVAGRVYTNLPAPGTAVSAAIVAKGLIDITAAYNAISPASKPGGTDPGAGELGGLTLPPGVYKSAGATFKITNGNLTLDAQGNANAVWIFQTAAGLTVGVAGPAGARSVNMINNGQAKNVYWHVGTSAIINEAGGGIMSGNIITTAGVTFSTAGNAVITTLNGRALSTVASVTMVNTVINVPNP